MSVDAFNVAKVPPQAIGEAMATKRERTERDLLVSVCQLLEENLAELRHLRAAVGMSSDSRSSVEVKTSTRGVDIASKSYSGSDVAEQVAPAVDAYFAALEAVQARVNGGSNG